MGSEAKWTFWCLQKNLAGRVLNIMMSIIMMMNMRMSQTLKSSILKKEKMQNFGLQEGKRRIQHSGQHGGNISYCETSLIYLAENASKKKVKTGIVTDR